MKQKKSRKEHNLRAKKARRAALTVLYKMQKIEELSAKLRNKLEKGSFRVTFNFSPDELGINPAPAPHIVEKLGLKRAMERLDRKDFYMKVSVIGKGVPNPQTLARMRGEVLWETRNKTVKSDGTVDLSGIGLKDIEDAANL
jgi:hypothetical protein